MQRFGWQFDRSPDERCLAGLNNPPFGLGLERTVEHRVLGTTGSGVPFQAFRYRCDQWQCPSGQAIVTMALPVPLPEFAALNESAPIPGVRGLALTSGAQVAVAGDAGYGNAVLGALRDPMAPLVAEFGATVTVDHANLVVIGVPREPEVLARVATMMEPMRAALADPAMAGFGADPAPVELSFHDHPDWCYRSRDDSLLSMVRHTGAGTGHRALEVVFRPVGPLPFIALTHKWETERTVTTTDSNGNTTTRTVTDHHSEEILEFLPQFNFVGFSVNAGLLSRVGSRVRFEWEDFNARFAVHSVNPRFASDVFHPRMLDYLMTTNPYPFRFDDDRRVRFDTPGRREDVIAGCDVFLRGFFGWVPDFVWEDLGSPRPFDRPGA